MRILKDRLMANSMVTRWIFVIISCANLLLMMDSAYAITLSMDSHNSTEYTTQTGPSNTLQLISKIFGYDYELTGPGGALAGVTYSGNNMTAIAGASSLQNAT